MSSRSPSPLRIAGLEPHLAPMVPPLYQLMWMPGSLDWGVVMPIAELVFEVAAEHLAWRVDAHTMNA